MAASNASSSSESDIARDGERGRDRAEENVPDLMTRTNILLCLAPRAGRDSFLHYSPTRPRASNARFNAASTCPFALTFSFLKKAFIFPLISILSDAFAMSTSIVRINSSGVS